MNFIARPIDAAFRKNESVESFRRKILRAVDVEARKIQRPIFPGVGNECDVVAIAGHERNRRFVARQFLH